MSALVYLFLATIMCAKIYGRSILNTKEEDLLPQSCDISLVTGRFENPDMTSLYYTKPYLSDNHRETERLVIQSKFQVPKPEVPLCPFVWTEDVKDNRIPRIIMTAKCQNLQSEVSGVPYTCADVIYPMQILKVDHCEMGYTVYRPDWVNVTVACQPVATDPAGSLVKAPVHELPGNLVEPSKIRGTVKYEEKFSETKGDNGLGPPRK